MKSMQAVNKRIIKEIDAIKDSAKIKQFLKEIMEVELENLDKGKPSYTDEFKNIMRSIFD